MRVCVTLEQRFHQTPDGRVWTDGPSPYSFWTRYLAAFDEVRAVARVRPAVEIAPGWVRADGPGVQFAAVPCYIGPWEFLQKRTAVRRAVWNAVEPHDAVIMRVPSNIGGVLYPCLRERRQPYAVEVVGDPYDAFAPGAVRHPLRPWFRWALPRALRRHCRNACAAAYVTASSLQRRYPPGPEAYSAYYSDVQIDGLLAGEPRPAATETAWRLVIVGSLGHLYKAQDVLIDAVALCRRGGLDVTLAIVGDGKHRGELEARAADLGIAAQVDFRGQLPTGAAITAELDRADVFVLPSRQEGLPRAMIEAMARGLPCVGATVGGIPELLPAEDLVPPGDAAALAAKLREVLGDCSRRTRMSQRNLQAAGAFQEDALAQRRVAFYEAVRTRTQTPTHFCPGAVAHVVS